MYEFFQIIENGLHMQVENILYIILMLGGIIIAAKDFTVGLVWYFFVSATTFAAYFAMHQNGATIQWNVPLIGTLIFAILMALMLQFTHQKVTQGGLV